MSIPLPVFVISCCVTLVFAWLYRYHLAESRRLQAQIEKHQQQLRDQETRQQPVEEALRRQQEYFRNLLDAAPNRIFVEDKDGYFTYANRATAEILGTTVDQLVGKNVSDIISSPERLRAIRGTAARVLAAPNEVFTIEEAVPTPQGSIRWNQTAKRSVPSLHGDELQVLVVITDITERKLAEGALRDSEARFRRILEQTPVGIYRTLPDGTILMANPALLHMLGYCSLKEMSEHNLVTDAISKGYDRQQFLNQMEENGIVRNLEVVLWRKDGTPLHVRESAQAVRDENGALLYFEGTFENVTAYKSVEAELLAARDQARQAQAVAETATRIKSEFLANMSHEIRTPMNGVLGMTELLRFTVLDAEQKDYVDTLQQSAEALLIVIDDILDFSKLEAGKIELRPTDYKLSSLISDVVALLESTAQKKGLVLPVCFAENIPPVIHGDPGRLRQVLLNLVGNAIKFTDRGAVSINCQMSQHSGDPRIRLEVKDTGIGISLSDQERLFQSFSQVDASPTRRFGGTGLGLAISKQLVELMGGTIGVDSIPGHGSTFWIELPLR